MLQNVYPLAMALVLLVRYYGLGTAAGMRFQIQTTEIVCLQNMPACFESTFSLYIFIFPFSNGQFLVFQNESRWSVVPGCRQSSQSYPPRKSNPPRHQTRKYFAIQLLSGSKGCRFRDREVHRGCNTYDPRWYAEVYGA